MNHPWPSKNVFFTGFMASGKTRIGEQTARMMGWHFIDTDRYIEEKEGCSINAIFETKGEDYFREVEYQTIKELSEKRYHIISLGGGAITRPKVLELIKAQGILVHLWAPVEVLSERIGRKNTRPLMAGLNEEERQNKIRSMLEERAPYYEQSDFSIESAEGTPVERLVKELRQYLVAWNYKKVQVSTPTANYPIFIGKNFTDLFRSIFSNLGIDHDFLIVTDNNVAQKQHQNLRKIQRQANNCRYFRFPAGEQFKNLSTLNRLFTYMLRKGFSRKTCLLQFSGGVIGDMAGFGAATYQRGIPFIQIPTTLLSMVDSSVGGKVAVNHQMGKNMIGAFYQPQAVLINLEVLETLPHEEYLAGLAEVIKYGVIWDESFFQYLEDNVELLLAKDLDALEKVVTRCCEIKADVVSQDEKETGIRAILNYGHTFGHAIEKITDYQIYSHGIAVALGMRCAARLSTKLKLWDPSCEERQNKLLDAFGFPKDYDMDAHLGWEAMGNDKKVDKGDRVFILPTRIGHVVKEVNPEQELVNQSWDSIRP